MALRWLIQREVLPIPGAKTGPQAAGNASAWSFPLCEAEMDALDTASN
jgi:diketogulonate reductase-like aldo/keto reductase